MPVPEAPSPEAPADVDETTVVAEPLFPDAVPATDELEAPVATSAPVLHRVTTPAPTVPPPGAPVVETPVVETPVVETPVIEEPVAPPSHALPTRVHAEHLVAPSPPVELTPSQAVRLASDGREVLTRSRPRAS